MLIVNNKKVTAHYRKNKILYQQNIDMSKLFFGKVIILNTLATNKEAIRILILLFIENTESKYKV